MYYVKIVCRLASQLASVWPRPICKRASDLNQLKNDPDRISYLTSYSPCCCCYSSIAVAHKWVNFFLKENSKNDTIWYHTIWYIMISYNTIRFDTIWYDNTIQYNPNENREVVLYEVSLKCYLETLFSSCKVWQLQRWENCRSCTKQKLCWT